MYSCLKYFQRSFSVEMKYQNNSFDALYKISNLPSQIFLRVSLDPILLSYFCTPAYLAGFLFLSNRVRRHVSKEH